MEWLPLARSASSPRSPAGHIRSEEAAEKGPLWPNTNYPAASKLIGTQVHSQQALIRVSFIQTTVFIEQRGAEAHAAINCSFCT